MYMKLAKQPETELEYWKAIKAFGELIWQTNRDLADGRIQDTTGKIDKDIRDAQKISKRLVSKLEEKFGVIPLEGEQKQKIEQDISQIPEGKQRYWDWYKKMEKLYYQEEYKKIVCSACPFSEGLEKMIELGGIVPCGKVKGTIYSLARPFECHQITFADLTPEQFYQDIFIEKGETALAHFKSKEAELKVMSVKEGLEV